MGTLRLDESATSARGLSDMSDPLATYLSDHVAGSQGAVNLLRFLRDHHAGEPVSRLAAELLVDVEEDRDVLEDLLERVGARRAAVLKEAVVWLGEKIGRLKLHRRAGEGLGTLMALESLALGIRGKLALWRALAAAATTNRRLSGVDFDHLIARARAQYDKVEELRLDVARTILGDPGK